METTNLREWLERYPTVSAQLARQDEIIREQILNDKISSGVLKA